MARSRAFRAALTASVAVLALAPAMLRAQADMQPGAANPAVTQVRERSYNVPAQDAVTGIPEFARQADIQILVSEDAVRGKRTAAISGTMSVDAALRRLIAKTGLVIASGDGLTYTLTRAEAPGGPWPPGAAEIGKGCRQVGRVQKRAVAAALRLS